jgi:hypothetical protein
MNIPIKKLLHQRNLLLASSVTEMSLKDKRICCAEVRKALESDHSKPNVLLPSWGLSVGEFCVIQVLSQDSKKQFREQLQSLASV